MRAFAPSQSFTAAYRVPDPYAGCARPQFAPAPAPPSPLPPSPPAVDPDEDDIGFSLVTVALGLIGGALAGFVCASGASSWMASGVIVMVLAALAVVNPRSCVIMTIAFLTVLGDVRRIVSLGAKPGSDPLVLVAPVVVVMLLLLAVTQNRVTRSTPLARTTFILLIVMAIQAVNPLQGGIMMGMSGVVCVMMPMCWFWVGQAWGSSRFVEALFFRVVVPLAVAAAIFGLYQVLFGKPDYQMQWMKVFYQERSAIFNLGKDTGGSDAMRPFAFFTSVSAFTKYLSVGIVLLLASAIGGKFRVLLFALPVLVVSLFFTSARGPVVVCCAVLIVLWAMRGKTKSELILRAVLAGACIIFGLAWTLNEVQEMEVSPELEYLVRHQTEGLLNPLDGQKSTATGHAQVALDGFIRSVHNPAGLGLGTATHVAGVFSAGQGAATEIDLSNMFMSLGLVGGLVYTWLYYRVFATAVSYWRKTRAPVAMAIAAVLMVLVFNWLNTGEYCTITLAWFCIGALDRLYTKAVRDEGLATSANLLAPAAMGVPAMPAMHGMPAVAVNA